jgi:hypothetical protein
MPYGVTALGVLLQQYAMMPVLFSFMCTLGPLWALGGTGR